MLASLVSCAKHEGVDEIKWSEVCFSAFEKPWPDQDYFLFVGTVSPLQSHSLLKLREWPIPKTDLCWAPVSVRLARLLSCSGSGRGGPCGKKTGWWKKVTSEHWVEWGTESFKWHRGTEVEEFTDEWLVNILGHGSVQLFIIYLLSLWHIWMILILCCNPRSLDLGTVCRSGINRWLS